jgi:hypothetical protein
MASALSSASLVLELSNPSLERLEEFNDWYAGEYLAVAQAAVPDFVGHQAYWAGPTQPDGHAPRWRHLAIYGADSGAAALADTCESLASALRASPLIDAADHGAVVWAFEPRGPANIRDAEENLHVVLSNASSSRDDDFNAWYDNHHMPEVLRFTPGFVSGRRFTSALGAPGTSPWRYLAIYQIDVVDVRPGMKAVDKVVATRGFTSSGRSLARDYTAAIYRRSEDPAAITAGR